MLKFLFLFILVIFCDAQPVSLGDPCWLPAFAVKLRDSSKCMCPMRSFKAVTISCAEAGAFEISHVSSGSATHQMALGRAVADDPGPLEYDDVSGSLMFVPCIRPDQLCVRVRLCIGN